MIYMPDLHNCKDTSVRDNRNKVQVHSQGDARPRFRLRSRCKAHRRERASNFSHARRMGGCPTSGDAARRLPATFTDHCLSAICFQRLTPKLSGRGCQQLLIPGKPYTAAAVRCSALLGEPLHGGFYTMTSVYLPTPNASASSRTALSARSNMRRICFSNSSMVFWSFGSIIQQD